mmetsp:Transcript_28492/g.64278  ORF Transcript_28492/g.64278 Transcript_28492/m.64278 type:complete len:160 (+) Transcript_28492:50-529(+)
MGARTCKARLLSLLAAAGILVGLAPAASAGGLACPASSSPVRRVRRTPVSAAAVLGRSPPARRRGGGGPAGGQGGDREGRTDEVEGGPSASSKKKGVTMTALQYKAFSTLWFSFGGVVTMMALGELGDPWILVYLSLACWVCLELAFAVDQRKAANDVT